MKEDLPGFLFESNRGTKHTFTAETFLGPEFSAGWANKKTKRMRGKSEAVQQKVKTTARDIYEKYFKAAQSQPRGTYDQMLLRCIISISHLNVLEQLAAGVLPLHF